LNDVLSFGSTEKFKLRKINPEKTHSVKTQQPIIDNHLEHVQMKLPIAWPKMDESDRWDDLDEKVSSKLTFYGNFSTNV